MNSMYRALLCTAVGVALMTGCAKAPSQEVSDAQAALTAATSADAQTYAAPELEQAKAAMSQAEAELKAQEGKFLKNFDQAKAMFAKAKADAEAVAAAIPARKEVARNAAAGAEAEARSAVEQAKVLLAAAPQGKGTQADLEAFQADVRGIEDALAEVTALVSDEKYAEASNKAKSLQEKALAISDQIQVAMAKVKP